MIQRDGGPMKLTPTGPADPTHRIFLTEQPSDALRARLLKDAASLHPVFEGTTFSIISSGDLKADVALIDSLLATLGERMASSG